MQNNFEHHTEDFEVFDFRDKANVAAYSIFSASKYIHDMLITCVNTALFCSKIGIKKHFSDVMCLLLRHFFSL